MITGDSIIKKVNFTGTNQSPMIKFFQVLFFTASIVSIVLNVIEYNKWQEARKEGSTKPYPIRWFGFIVSSLVALGCMLNILISWIG